MEAASVPAPKPSSLPEGSGAGEKGLKAGAIGFVSGIVIGVASTAPGYSLAASLGLVVGIVGIGVQAPVIMIAAFIPMLLIASAYYWMNRADPDCGTTFSWVTRAMGPWLGWIAGWAIFAADVIVMANLSDIAGIYSFSLVGIDSPSKYAVLAVGVIWIVLMTAICYIGIEVSAKVQWGLLGAEVVILVLFAAVALIKVATGDVADSVTPSLSWINPLEIPTSSALAGGLIAAIFIYWGWDSTVTVNEESVDATEGPGKAALWSTVILVAIYVVVSIAAQAFHGPQFLADNSDDVLIALGRDVLGSPFDKLLIFAVLTSAAASTQTTILPTTRTMLSMAAKKAAPAYFARVHPRYLTPSTSTIWMGLLSIIWYVALKLISDNVLYDAIAALGMMIAFYYGITGFACPIFYRRVAFRGIKNLVLITLAPVIGGVILFWALAKSLIDSYNPANSYSGAWLGMGPPFVIGVGFILLGAILMVIWAIMSPEFFRRRPEVADPSILEAPAATVATGD